VMSNPAWKAKYRERFRELYETVLKPVDWGAKIVEEGQRVQAELAKRNPQWAKDYQNVINQARDRVVRRIAVVGKHVGDVPKPPQFDKDNTLKITEGWGPENGNGGDAAIDEATADGKKSLHIRANGPSSGSWRKVMNLPAGRYKFEARLKTAGVAPLDSTSGKGAGLRISGGTRQGQNAVEGDSGWQQVSFPFESPGGEVILVAELRAQKGEVWFDRDSLRIVWMK